jgi:methylated-DNA-[protein]-cysteine S-methyltransferase
MDDELILPTPFGAPLRLRSSGDAVVACDWAPRARASSGRVRDAVLRDAKAQIAAYFRKRLIRFDLPLHFEGTPFQIAVWTLVSRLETGELISYADVGRAIGAPLSHRGVAAAMGRTPFALLVPAHRVIGADGKIKGAGPNSMRRKLLRFEGIEVSFDKLVLRQARPSTRSG